MSRHSNAFLHMHQCVLTIIMLTHPCSTSISSPAMAALTVHQITCHNVVELTHVHNMIHSWQPACTGPRLAITKLKKLPQCQKYIIGIHIHPCCSCSQLLAGALTYSSDGILAYVRCLHCLIYKQVQHLVNVYKRAWQRS